MQSEGNGAEPGDHALFQLVKGKGWIAPAIDAAILTVLWAAYLIAGMRSPPGP